MDGGFGNPGFGSRLPRTCRHRAWVQDVPRRAGATWRPLTRKIRKVPKLYWWPGWGGGRLASRYGPDITCVIGAWPLWAVNQVCTGFRSGGSGDAPFTQRWHNNGVVHRPGSRLQTDNLVRTRQCRHDFNISFRESIIPPPEFKQ